MAQRRIMVTKAELCAHPSFAPVIPLVDPTDPAMSELASSPGLPPDSSSGRPHAGPTELIGFILVAFLGAAAAAFGMPGEWFEGLNKPSWNPPAWLFGPVWTVLYITIGTSAWWMVRHVGWQRARPALIVWSVQMVLNIAWTPVFFGLHQPAVALVIIVAMWLAILATIVAFARLHKPAGLLLIPYLAWVSFATALNAALWWLNR
jgi:tryptophan-rich sensory protein